MADTFKVYIDKAGEGRWTKHANSDSGEVVADSGEGYGGGLPAARNAARRDAKDGDRIVLVNHREGEPNDEVLVEVVGEPEDAEA